jgi:hypothetical protein
MAHQVQIPGMLEAMGCDLACILIEYQQRLVSLSDLASFAGFIMPWCW